MFSNNLDKYEYLTGEDLGLKQSTIEQAKFEYSPLGKMKTKMKGSYKQGEKQLKQLKNIDKSKMLKAIVEISNKKKKQKK